MNRKFTRLFPRLTLFLLALAVLAACGVPRFDPSTLEGRVAIMDAARQALNSGDCATAITVIDPLYNSEYVTNESRLIRASAFACAAGIPDFFGFALALAGGNFAGKGLWPTFAKAMYPVGASSPATILAKRDSAGAFALDALLAIITPGQIPAQANEINAGSFNVGSTLASDRTNDANFYGIFVNIANMGNLEDAYGAPNTSTWARGQILGKTGANANGWTDASFVSGDACLYASSLLNFLDDLSATSASLPSNLSALGDIPKVLNPIIAGACNAGCQGSAAYLGTSYVSTGCAFVDTQCQGTNTQPCLMALRDRTSCKALNTDRASCAAAGIANLVSRDAFWGWN